MHNNMIKMLRCPLMMLPIVLFFCCAPVKGDFHCQTGIEWWNGTCVPCTKCAEVVLRTCQPHKDTICGSFQDIKINVIQVAFKWSSIANPSWSYLFLFKGTNGWEGSSWGSHDVVSGGGHLGVDGNPITCCSDHGVYLRPGCTLSDTCPQEAVE